ncbi:hypothetical protein BP5796_02024 [Coleophoma crateriformis]|uniref:Low temperature requirement A n=1 Tax=Coleophoma crateriformis TaxID=565419 RepID=A0A3D8T270_9HELO|nr:hypothetical protein BP5796_02024 [Coleophoma crateriformis]
MSSPQEAHESQGVDGEQPDNQIEVHRTQFNAPERQKSTASDHSQEKSPEKTVQPATKIRTPYVQLRPFTHKYFIRRPRALQYFQDGNYVETLPSRHDSHQSEEAEPPEPNSSMWLRSRHRVPTALIPLPDGTDTRNTEEPILQRKRIDLFIDLLWVGIVSNISESFTNAAFHEDGAYGIAFLEYLVLFFIAWQIWNYLRDLLNTYFTDDLLQRAVIVWVLILALLFGNSTTYFTNSQETQKVIIVIFLIARGTFFFTEAIYLCFLPSLRKQFMYRFFFSTLVGGLFVGAIYLKWPANSGLYIPAIVLEMASLSFTNSPMQDRLLKGQHRKAPDPEHLVDRFEGFFILIVGEGVFLLIKNSPLGLGVTTQSSLGVMVLVIYHTVFSIYSASDQSKNYIHAVRRAWWSTTLWIIIHTWIFASFLLCDASFLYLIQNSAERSSPSAATENVGADNTGSGATKSPSAALLSAKWTAAVTLGITLLCLTGKDLLNKSLDPPGTLIISNRFSLIAATMAMIWGVGIWEWFSGLEHGAKFVEPSHPPQAQ